MSKNCMKLILAVSGGVDSVVMLHSLVNKNSACNMGLELIVAHFDHGIRDDSKADARFVEALTAGYDLKFELGRGDLSARASEATARKARWKFLKEIRKKCVILVDDVLNTGRTFAYGLKPFLNIEVKKIEIVGERSVGWFAKCNCILVGRRNSIHCIIKY